MVRKETVNEECTEEEEEEEEEERNISVFIFCLIFNVLASSFLLDVMLTRSLARRRTKLWPAAVRPQLSLRSFDA